MRAFNLADLFEVVADACPERMALVAGEARLTYADLESRANRVAHHLASIGVRAGDHVGILSHNRAEWVESMIGCFKLRAAPVNLNYRYVADELRHLLDDSGCVALIGEPDLLDRIHDTRLPTLRIGEEYEKALAAASPVRDFAERSGDDPYLLYTGGTTGLPKGVLWRCEDIFFAAMGGGNFGGPPIAEPEDLAAAADREPLRTQVHAPLMHGGGQWITWITLTTGGTVILWTGRSFDARRTLELAVRERTQILMLVGNGMALPIAEELSARPYDLEVFAFGSGGAPLSSDVRERLLAARPGAYVSDNLGGSETGAMGPSAGDGRFTLGPEFAVLGPFLMPAREGVVARTGHIPLCYLNDPVKTAETFVTGPDGRRWVLQGDHAIQHEDGSITLLGRGSLVINSGGEKVYAEEVETVLRGHPAVAEAVVVGIPDARLGAKVAAVLQLHEPVADTDLMAYCRDHIASYKIPCAFHFTETIHRTPVGKPDYSWARTLF